MQGILTSTSSLHWDFVSYASNGTGTYSTWSMVLTGAPGIEGPQGNTGAQGPQGPSGGGEGGSAFPFTGSAGITGSLSIVGPLELFTGDGGYKVMEFSEAIDPFFQFNSNVKVNSGYVRADGGFYSAVIDNPSNQELLITNTGGLGDIRLDPVNGKVKISGSIQVDNQAEFKSGLILPFVDPLPSDQPTGSIFLSGSAGTYVGMFVYNGTSWVSA
jgi:hypothetical protein